MDQKDRRTLSYFLVVEVASVRPHEADPGAAENRHGISTSLTRLTVVRFAT
jgi:hypothetical protein